MSSPDESSTEERLDQLEARVERVERAVAALHEAVVEEQHSDEPDPPSGPAAPPESSSSSTPAPADSASSSPVERTRRVVAQFGRRSEDWLNAVGIGLLLFGLAFLFKYSVDQGWLVPSVRIAFGAAMGTVLLVGGLRVYAERRRLRQILLGGSSAVFYGTVFAAYQLYGLLAYPLAFGAMLAITVASISLALLEDEAVLAVVGTAGGLGTPFLLYAEVGTVAGLAGYTWLVLAGACAVYVSRGWRSLLAVAASGGWLVLLVPCLEAGLGGTRPDGAWGLQGGLVGAWALLAGTPVLRAGLRERGPGRWARPSAPRWVERLVGRRPVYGAMIASPLLVLLGSRLLWGGADATWAALAGLGAVGYAAAYGGLRRFSLPRLAPVHGLVAALLATYGLSEAVGGATLLLVWAVEALLLLVLAARLDDAALRWTGRALFGVVALGLAERLRGPTADGLPLLAPEALSELGVAVLLAAAGRWAVDRWEGRLYWGGALVAWLAWWAAELSPVPNGQAYVSAVWAVTAAGLLVVGSRGRQAAAQWAGLAALALFVGKLFLVDLAAVPALWRIVLFVGAGGGFLLVSYALPQVGGDAEA
jgi:uncharacterized membrane protein